MQFMLTLHLSSTLETHIWGIKTVSRIGEVCGITQVLGDCLLTVHSKRRKPSNSP